MAVFTSDSVDRLNSIGDKKLRSYLYKLNEDLIYMFNNLTPEDNYSDLARLVYVETQDNVARLEVRADGIELEVKDNADNISNLSVRADGIETKVTNNTSKISQVSQTVDGVSATVTNTANNYNSSMKLLANMFSLGVSTPAGSSAMVLTGDKIALSTGKFTVNAKNFSVDASGNATFSGDISGATLTGCDIVGGSINIADGSFYADSGWVKFGDFQVSTNASNVLQSNDGSFKIRMKSNNGTYYPEIVMEGLSSRGDISISNGQITGVYCLQADYVDADSAKKYSYFYDINLGKSWWGGDSITETVQTLWENVEDLSDESVKENIYDIDADEALQFILATHTVTFQYKKDGKWSAGMIAQEVDALQDSLEIYYPLVELESKSQKYRIEYKNYIPLLIAAVQNLQAQITELKGEADGNAESTVSEITG